MRSDPLRKKKNHPLKKRSKEKMLGFTLVELLVSISLLAISVGISSDIIVSLVRTFGRTQIFHDTEQTVNFLFLKLQNDLKNSLSSEVNLDGNELTMLRRNDVRITYTVTEDDPPNVTRQVGTGDPVNLIDTQSPIGGIRISCENGCFERVSTTPHSIRINMTFSQSTGIGLFDSEISIEDTFVLRGSY